MLQGGVKVLITGPWLESSSEYSCLFDHISVPAALIQPGVLRCYCPGNTLLCERCHPKSHTGQNTKAHKYKMTFWCLHTFIFANLMSVCSSRHRAGDAAGSDGW